MSKIVLVTGAGRGIGAATARRLAEDGYDICINYRRDEKAADEVAQSVAAAGQRAICVRADISSEADVVRLFETMDEELGRINVLINNAGILHTQSKVVDMTAERISDVFATNVIGAFLCCREAIKRMSREFGGQGGVIVNVSSGAARTGSPGEYVDYASSKGAMDTMTIGLANEVARQMIRVNGVRPGFVYTDMHKSGGEPDRVDRIKNSLPLQRGGQPEEVAAAIAWLVSDESSYTTGSFIDVTGGR